MQPTNPGPADVNKTVARAPHRDAATATAPLVDPAQTVRDAPRTELTPAGAIQPASKGSGSKSSSPRLGLLKDSASTLSTATRALRQSRLRAASLFLAIWWVTIAGRSILYSQPGWVIPTVVTICLAAVFFLLSPRMVISGFALRTIELLMFTILAANFAIMQYQIMLDSFSRGDPVALAATIPDAVIAAITLMFAYTVLIPNTWLTALWIVITLAIYPAVTAWVVFLTQPQVLEFGNRYLVFSDFNLNVFKMVVAACLAVFGAHVLETLRHEVFEARRLNQYQLGGKLGSGGMGEVYLAEHRLLRRPCALKMIRPERAGDRTALTRLEREVRSAARLSHPNIVEIYDYGHTDDGTFYYVMERLGGLNLAELVERYGRLPPGRAIYLLRQACDGLAEAHDAGLIHRDLKPANIFAAHIGRRYDVAKLLDFGLVKATDEAMDLTAAGALFGTPLYMSPEQVAGSESLDHRADLYALGAVAYYVVTGRPPFEGRTPLSVMVAHARDAVIPPSQRCPDLPQDLERIVLRCLEKRPGDRYADAESLAAALAACAAAGDWDAGKAASWWQEVEAKAQAASEPAEKR